MSIRRTFNICDILDKRDENADETNSIGDCETSGESNERILT